MSRSLRFCMPQRLTRRGAGLGNELHGYAKAILAAQALGAKPLSPAWGRNSRAYWRYFGSSRLDWIQHSLLGIALPSWVFDEADYVATGERDFAKAVGVYAAAHQLQNRTAFVLITGGMWGGLAILRPAFPFVWRLLYSAAGTARNLSDLQRRIPAGTVTIAIHVRLGEFAPELPDQDRPPWSQWNWALPLEWYIEVCRSLRRQLDVPQSYVLLTDGSPDELRPLTREVNPVTLFHQNMNVCSDLIAAASCDVLVCSRSSFSMWAAALSERPYIWPSDSLYPESDSLAIWDHGEPIVGVEDPKRQTPRGVPVTSSGAVPSDLIQHLEAAYLRKGLSTDLVFYGRVPRTHLI